MDTKKNYDQLVEGLKLLILSREQKKEFLPKYVEVEFEIFNNFQDVFLTLPQIIDSGLLTNSAIASIIRCFNLIEFTLRNDNNTFKKNIKEHAINALDEMNEDHVISKIRNIQWVQDQKN